MVLLLLAGRLLALAFVCIALGLCLVPPLEISGALLCLQTLNPKPPWHFQTIKGMVLPVRRRFQIQSLVPLLYMNHSLESLKGVM